MHGKELCLLMVVVDIIINYSDKYFQLKDSWGTGVPLNSNYLLATSPCMFNNSDSWGCSMADGLKDAVHHDAIDC